MKHVVKITHSPRTASQPLTLGQLLSLIGSIVNVIGTTLLKKEGITS